jgi:hypothetical protein
MVIRAKCSFALAVSIPDSSTRAPEDLYTIPPYPINQTKPSRRANGYAWDLGRVRPTPDGEILRGTALFGVASSACRPPHHRSMQFLLHDARCAANLKPKRAAKRTRTADLESPATSVPSGVAGAFTDLQTLHRNGVFCSLCCPLLQGHCVRVRVKPGSRRVRGARGLRVVLVWVLSLGAPVRLRERTTRR